MNNWYLLAAIPVFGLLVLVHEFGHFITAKWAGIRVEEFGLGFPPRLVGIRRRDQGGWEVVWFGGGQTEESAELDQKNTPFSGTSGGITAVNAPVSNHTLYSLNLLPIGGFVRMPGENGDMLDEQGHYDEQSFAAKSAGKRIIVLCAGVTMNVILAMVLFSIAYGLGEPVIPPVIGHVVANTPAAVAGLQSGDMILAVNGQSVGSFSDIQNIVQSALAADKESNPNAVLPIQLTLRHAGSTTIIHTTVNARLHPPAGQGAMGIDDSNVKVTFATYPIWQTPFRGVVHTYQVTHDFLGSIGQMVTGSVKPQLAGPVGIVKITGEVAQSVPSFGWWPILSLTAVLSLNLAIVNILPFPALDGGRILLILIELLRGGKRLKPEREGLINFIGMAILLTLMVVITISDITHWGG